MSDTTTIHLYQSKDKAGVWIRVGAPLAGIPGWWASLATDCEVHFHPTQASALAAVERERAQGQPDRSETKWALEWVRNVMENCLGESLRGANKPQWTRVVAVLDRLSADKPEGGA